MIFLTTRTKMMFLFSMVVLTGNAQQKEDLIGYWKSCDVDDNMVVRVQLNANDDPIGHLIGFQNEDGTWEQRKPLKGTKVMYNFKYRGGLEWNKGKIYDPIKERTYAGVVRLKSKDTVLATGYWTFLSDDILFKKITLTEQDEPKR